MPSKPKIDVNDKEVRREVQKSKGVMEHIGKPSRATGRRAERIAAKQQGTIHELKRADSKSNKKTESASDQGSHKTKKPRKAA